MSPVAIPAALRGDGGLGLFPRGGHAQPSGYYATQYQWVPVAGGDGHAIRLSEVADVAVTWTPNKINRENVSRRIVVQHNVQGRPLGDGVADVGRALVEIRGELARTPGHSIHLSGQFEAQQEASSRLIWLSSLALLARFFILFIHYRSVNLAMQVLATSPMAMIGAVGYVVPTNQTISIAVLVGLISLSGVADRNGNGVTSFLWTTSLADAKIVREVGLAADAGLVGAATTAGAGTAGVVPIAVATLTFKDVLHCGGCVKEVTKALRAIKAVKQVEVPASMGTVSIVFDTRTGKIEEFEKALADIETPTKTRTAAR